MTTWSMDELRRRLEEHKEEVIDICGPEMDEEAGDEYFLYYLSEASDAMTNWLKGRGLFVATEEDGERYLNFDRSRFEEIRLMAASVIDEYDSDEDHGVWSQFNLSGDDDVDYNGGYIFIILNVLELLDQ